MHRIGIDVHKPRCVAAVKGGVLPRGAPAHQLCQRHRRHNAVPGAPRQGGLPPARAACESTSTYWEILYGTLRDAGIGMLVAHPHHARMITQTKYKDDKVDAGRPAEMGRLGVVPASYMPTQKGRGLRKLARARHGLKGSTSTYKNRTEAAIAAYPPRRPAGDTHLGRGRTRLGTAPFRAAIDANLDIIDATTGQADHLGKVMAKKALNDPDVRKIITLPGMGHILALTVKAEIVEIGRFATPEKMASYAGLAPSRRDSGDRNRTGGITGRGSVWMRAAMAEAAFVAVRHDQRLRAIYERIAERRGPTKAGVAAARRMPVSVHHMLTEQADYRHQDRSLVKRKLRRIRRVAESPE